MYTKESFLTVEMVERVWKTFEWPHAYFVEDIVDGINVSFPKSNFTFTEDYWWERVTVLFLPEDTKEKQFRVTIEDAIKIFAPKVKISGWDFFRLKGPHSYETVLEAVTRNSKLVNDYLLPVVNGDFSWVKDVKEQRLSKRK